MFKKSKVISGNRGLTIVHGNIRLQSRNAGLQVSAFKLPADKYLDVYLNFFTHCIDKKN